jgi:hypothetical protein
MNEDARLAGLRFSIFLLFKGQAKRFFEQLYRKKEDCAKPKSNPKPSLSGKRQLRSTILRYRKYNIDTT